MGGTSLARAESTVGAAAAGMVSTRTELSLSVKTKALPSIDRAQPSGTLISYCPGCGRNATKAVLSGMSPTGLVSAGCGAPFPVDAEPPAVASADAAGPDTAPEPDEPHPDRSAAAARAAGGATT